MSDLTDLISQAASKYGQDPDTLLRMGQIESNLNPNAQNPNSSAKGLYQFTDGTAAQYGLSNPFDPAASADAGARLMRDNRSTLTSALGRDPTGGELYLAHQQGAGGAAKLLANPDAPAASLVGQDAVRLNGGTPGMTAGQFASLWTNKFGGPSTTAVAAPASSATPGQYSSQLASQFDPARALALAQPVGTDGLTMLPTGPALTVQNGRISSDQAQKRALQAKQQALVSGQGGLAALFA